MRLTTWLQPGPGGGALPAAMAGFDIGSFTALGIGMPVVPHSAAQRARREAQSHRMPIASVLTETAIVLVVAPRPLVTSSAELLRRLGSALDLPTFVGGHGGEAVRC